VVGIALVNGKAKKRGDLPFHWINWRTARSVVSTLNKIEAVLVQGELGSTVHYITQKPWRASNPPSYNWLIEKSILPLGLPMSAD
jgi:hypothetical protein